MPQNPQEFAALFGAKLIGELPDTGAGPFGIAHLANIMHRRLAPSNSGKQALQSLRKHKGSEPKRFRAP
jgi:hypothetical protein